MAQTSSFHLTFFFPSTCLLGFNTYLSQLISPPPRSLFFSRLQHLQVDVMFHEAHPSIPGPALLVVVAYNVLVVGIWMLCQVALNQVSCLICCKPGNAQKRNWSYTTIMSHHQSAHKDKDLLMDKLIAVACLKLTIKFLHLPTERDFSFVSTDQPLTGLSFHEQT